MGVIRYEDMDLAEVKAEGVQKTLKANVIGKPQGWPEHTLRVFRIQGGGFTPRHRHDWEHVNYIIKGRGRLRLGDTVHELKEKDFAFVPPDTEHQFENPYEADFEFICIVPDRGAN
ncbi:MAG: cupin domain-containing protein [Candidatus Hydrogenedentota bacterium]|nr:MAG: cupin domain-containing protein [Candidatus Hydrogenedentota bacterium]